MKHLLIILAIVSIAACSEKREQVATPAVASAPARASSEVVASAVPSQSATPALDAKALMQCASEENIVKRLACFDAFAKDNGLAPTTKETTASSTGKWRTSTDKDPLTDKSVHYAMLEADEGRGRYGDSINLVIRCKSGRTEAFINWNTFLGTDGLNVTSRVDKAPAVNSYWGISTDNKASFMPQQVATLKKFVGASSYVVNLTPYSESPITAIFDITGAAGAFAEIRRDCKW